MKHPDDTPAPGELVEVTVSNYQSGYRVANNYTSDQNGEIKFTLPAVDATMTDYSINVSFSEWVKIIYNRCLSIPTQQK